MKESVRGKSESRVAERMHKMQKQRRRKNAREARAKAASPKEASPFN
jgi:hypothetical protein